MRTASRLGPALCLCALLTALTSPPLHAQEAFLVTYGPGQEVWELFGHNAIWIRDPEQGIDHSFSFGYFELDRPGFYQDFARGIMPYYGAAGRIEREFAFYRERDRDIRVQQLNLSPDAVTQLFNRLHQSIFPQPQYYDYDYYWANCSTRLRDLLDEITGGALSEQLRARAPDKNLRDHTRALTAHRFFIYTGIQTLLGPMIDQSIAVWDETFLPRRLAEALNTIELAEGPLVLDDRQLFESASVTGRFDAPGLWPVHLALGLVCLGLLLGFARRSGVITGLAAAAVGLAGFVLALMWLGSGHEATWRNAMLLVLNPLWLVWLAPLPPAWRAGLWWLLLVSVLAGGSYLALPLGQFRPDVLLWYLPLVAGLLYASRVRRVIAERSRLPAS
jgi:hypothetical protein